MLRTGISTSAAFRSAKAALVQVLFLLFGLATPVLGQARTRLEIFADDSVPATTQHEWAQVLAAAGVEDVRITGKTTLKKVEIETAGTRERQVYLVTGMLNSAGDLVLPGVRFRLSEARAVARWLKDLAEKGPPDQREKEREKESGAGLTEKQAELLHAALSPAVGFSTRGASRADAFRKIADKLAIRLAIPSGLLEKMEGDKLAEELSGLSSGTALACLLRPAGLCVVPKAEGNVPELAVVVVGPGLKTWPVGWPPRKPSPKVLPALADEFNANVQGVSLPTVLEAVSKRLGVPILLDHYALAQRGIDPEKAVVNVPPSRTTHDRLLRKILLQAQLRMELRLDEADHPFLWVTTIKPVQ